MNKYYTPKIEDFYVGFEYEGLISGISLEYWEYDKFFFHPLYSEYLEKRINNNEIRVPYLTKEQIIGEGWKERSDIEEKFKNKGCYFKKQFESGEEIFLSRGIKFGGMNGKEGSRDSFWNIYGMMGDIRLIDISFTGNIPSINEFRKICKLLEI